MHKIPYVVLSPVLAVHIDDVGPVFQVAVNLRTVPVETVQRQTLTVLVIRRDEYDIRLRQALELLSLIQTVDIQQTTSLHQILHLIVLKGWFFTDISG